MVMANSLEEAYTKIRERIKQEQESTQKRFPTFESNRSGETTTPQTPELTPQPQPEQPADTPPPIDQKRDEKAPPEPFTEDVI